MTTSPTLPGMVDVSAEAHAAGVASGLRLWRATFPFGVTVDLHAADLADAEARAGDEVLMLEDLAEAEQVEPHVTPNEILAEYPRIRGGSYRLVRITVGYKCAGAGIRYQDHETFAAHIMNPEGTIGGQAFKTRAEAEDCLTRWMEVERRDYA